MQCEMFSQRSTSSNPSRSAEICPPCIGASADSSSPTADSTTASKSAPTADECVGCDWNDVVGGGCVRVGEPMTCACGICNRKTHHLCQVKYEEKLDDSRELQVRCSHCFEPGVTRRNNSSHPIACLPQQSSDTTSNETGPVVVNPLRKKGGRPKGVTKAGQKEKERKKALMTNHLATIVKAAQEDAGGQLKYGTYPKLHQAAQKHFGLEDVVIPYETIKKRIQRGNPVVSSMGPKHRPLEKLEPFILDIVKQAQEAGQPLTPPHFLELVNSLLVDSTVSEELRKYNVERLLHPDTKVSKSYYNGFMKRHNLQSTPGTRKSTFRMEAMTVDNIKRMYNLVYAAMVKAGVAVDLPEDEHYYVDGDGNVTTDESKIVGEKCTQKVVHPDYILMADEVGSDMAQEEDGAIGGQRYITDYGVANLRGSKNSHRFTIFPITSGTGELVMNVIIFAAKEISFITRMGLDLKHVSEYDPMKPLNEQIGAGTPFPGAPKTTYRGVDMEAYITCNESGSMTGEILAGVLQKIDEYGVFERTENGPRPLLLVDGHGSRLTLPVLRYVNSVDEFGRRRWHLTLGCPNATELWQQGDQSCQNGYLKIELTKEKEAVMRIKRQLKLTEALTRSDVIPILNRALPKSFGREESNKRSLARLGWNPLNRALLEDPRLLQRAVPSSASANATSGESYQSLDAMGLNLTNGTAGTTVMNYFQQLQSNVDLQQARDAQMQRADETQGSLEHIKGRITAGKLYGAGQAVCDSRVLALVEAREDARVDKLYETLRKKAISYDTILAKHEKLVASGKDQAKYTNSDMKVFIGVRRLKQDGSLPTTRPDLLRMMSNLANREQLDLKRYLMSHCPKNSEEEIDAFLTRYNNSSVAESEDEDEELVEIGQRAEV